MAQPVLSSSDITLENDQVKTTVLSLDLTIPGGVPVSKRTMWVSVMYPKQAMLVESHAQSLQMVRGSTSSVNLGAWTTIDGMSNRLYMAELLVGHDSQSTRVHGTVEFTVSNPRWNLNVVGDYQAKVSVSLTKPVLV